MWGEFDYSRSGNPTRKAFETTLASLEGGGGALAFASGMAAIHCVTMLLGTGDHILAGADIYGGTYRLLHKIINRTGIEVTLVAATDPAAFEAAITPATQLVWIESPGNPLLSITDIAGLRGDRPSPRRAVGGSTARSPLRCSRGRWNWGPTSSCTRRRNTLAAIATCWAAPWSVQTRNCFDRLYFMQNATGAVMGPLEAFLCSRGLKTLELRVREQCRTAAALAEFLANDRRVGRVFYPGLAGHPGHAIGRAPDAGGVRRDASASKWREISRDQTRCAKHAAVSAGRQPGGGRIAHRAAGRDVARQLRCGRPANIGITDSLIRLSVGLEAFEDLRDDLDQALTAALA